jgi:glycosyltransferase involved in cell wall biosynthesis
MSESENFAVTVVESLVCGTPVICSKNAPWSGLAQNNCGYWIDNSVFELHNVLMDILRMDKEKYLNFRENGIQWVNSDFNWNKIAEDMLSNYKKLFYHED